MTWSVLQKQLFPKCCQKSLSKFLVCSANENARREQRKGGSQRKILKLLLSGSVSVSAEGRGTWLSELNYRYLGLCLYQLKVEWPG